MINGTILVTNTPTLEDHMLRNYILIALSLFSFLSH
jgi:hypothetical protein